MTTSKAILFTKENCKPCTLTKEYIFALKNDLLRNLVIMKKENHSALVAAYELDLYPTLLLVDSKGEEVDRLVGGQKIRDNIVNILNTVNENHK